MAKSKSTKKKPVKKSKITVKKQYSNGKKTKQEDTPAHLAHLKAVEAKRKEIDELEAAAKKAAEEIAERDELIASGRPEPLPVSSEGTARRPWYKFW